MTYKQYNFISSKGVVAQVKATLSSYFDTGVIDDTLFPTWIVDCLRRIGMSSYDVKETVLTIDNYISELPPDFKQVREAWMSTIVGQTIYPIPSSTYITRDYVIDRYSEDSLDRCHTCDEEPCCCLDNCELVRKITTKHNGALVLSYKHTFPLRAGTTSAKDSCCQYSINRISRAHDTFDIKGTQFVTNFESGLVALSYYADPSLFSDEIQIPDNQWVIRYITKFLIFQCYDALFHQVTDETFNQISHKRQLYDMEQQEAWGDMTNNLKKHTVQQDRDMMAKTRARYAKFQINF